MILIEVLSSLMHGIANNFGLYIIKHEHAQVLASALIQNLAVAYAFRSYIREYGHLNTLNFDSY